MYFKEIGLRPQKTVNHSKINSPHHDNCGPIWSFIEKENLHSDKEWDIHMSSEDAKQNGYEHKLDLLIISH